MKFSSLAFVGLVAAENKEILASGAWQIDSDGAAVEHVFDQSLAEGLISFFSEHKATSVIDLGAGMGHYTEAFRNAGIFANCYDGNPNT